MSAVSSDTIKICEGVVWETVSIDHTHSFFPEEALESLAPSGLDEVVTRSDAHELLDHLGEITNTAGSDTTEVWSVKDDKDLVVKLSRTPFSYMAINAALEAGLASGSRYTTPAYRGALLLRSGCLATIMSRVEGKPLKNVNISDGYADQLEEHIISAGQAALSRVGISKHAIFWDLNSNNLFVPHRVTSPSELAHNRVTLIDQTSTIMGNPAEWYEAARQKDPYGDPRDREAEDAAEKAWALRDTLDKALV